jgi:hypothetical protein
VSVEPIVGRTAPFAACRARAGPPTGGRSAPAPVAPRGSCRTPLPASKRECTRARTRPRRAEARGPRAPPGADTRPAPCPARRCEARARAPARSVRPPPRPSPVARRARLDAAGRPRRRGAPGPGGGRLPRPSSLRRQRPARRHRAHAPPRRPARDAHWLRLRRRSFGQPGRLRRPRGEGRAGFGDPSRGGGAPGRGRVGGREAGRCRRPEGKSRVAPAGRGGLPGAASARDLAGSRPPGRGGSPRRRGLGTRGDRPLRRGRSTAIEVEATAIRCGRPEGAGGRARSVCWTVGARLRFEPRALHPVTFRSCGGLTRDRPAAMS